MAGVALIAALVNRNRHADEPYAYFLTCGMSVILIEYGAQRDDFPAE
jgi:hypothetical protein